MHILITLSFALCLIFDLEKLPLLDLKSKICGISEPEDDHHVGRFSKLTTAGLVMWTLYLIAERLIKMSVEGKIGGNQCELNSGQTIGVTVSATCPAGSHFVDVPHVQQQFHWDCGLACVLMVLRTVGIQHYDIHHLADLCSTTSEQLQNDLGRVDALFEKALETGITIECRSINGVDIATSISSGKYIAVALVNKINLSHYQKKDEYIPVGNSDYIGHFIVICGYDAEANEFEIRDPASTRKIERVSLECLDTARKCYGTDEDIILVSLQEEPLTESHDSC